MSSENPQFTEVWLTTTGGQAMCALTNGGLGWLMYLREEGDAGFSSRNPEYAGPPDAEIEYELSNGQHDLYPASWALPMSEINRALEYFRQEQRPPGFITWHNDSGDGATIRDR